MSYKSETIKEAVEGTEDYHALMRSIAVSSLRRKAGFIPQNTGSMKLLKNLVNWQSASYNINAGIWWIFYATEQGYFSPAELRKIWRYGQALKLFKKYYSEYCRWFPKEDKLHNWMKDTVLDPSKYVYEKSDVISFHFHTVRKELEIEVYGGHVVSQDFSKEAYAVGIIAHLCGYIYSDNKTDFLKGLRAYRDNMKALILGGKLP